MATPYIAAFIMGILGSAHCAGMCGAITVALGANTKAKKMALLTLCYQIFRIISYGLLGLFSGYIGAGLQKWSSFPWLTVVGAALMIMMGLYLLGLWNLLSYFEKGGRIIWQKVSPLQKRFLPLRYWHQAMVIGLLWGLLPCGLVYSAIAIASTSGGALEGWLAMMFFGLGTLPSLMTVSLLSSKFLGFFKQKWLRTIFALVFIAWGTWQFYAVITNSNGANSHHTHHLHHE